MAAKVFISFRYSDGNDIKESLSELFETSDVVIDNSESENRSDYSDEYIKDHLYKKLKGTSVTIVLITPDAMNYKVDSNGKIDDWIYDEVKYSLDDRDFNRMNAVVAVYTDEVREKIVQNEIHTCDKCNSLKEINNYLEFHNLARKNMFNIKPEHKSNNCDNLFNVLEDSYISLIHIDKFINNHEYYIENALKKRNNSCKFQIIKRL